MSLVIPTTSINETRDSRLVKEECLSIDCPGNGREGSDRDRSTSRSGLLQPDLSGPKIRKQMETSYRFIGYQIPRVMSNVQDGNPSGSTELETSNSVIRMVPSPDRSG